MAGITTTIDHTLEEAQKHRTAAAASPSVSSVPLTSAKLESGLRDTLWRFVHEECIPAERVYAEYMAEVPHKKRFAVHPPIMETLKSRARELGLWNLWMTDEYPQSTTGLTLSEYAPLAEIMGRSFLASEACNCSAPDTGNMEVLAKYGSPAQQASWLRPLLDGSIRSAFLMTEPAVASSDARNICTTMHRDGDEYVVNGTKWWSTGACNPRCKVAIVMGKTDESASAYKQQSMLLVPMDAPGVTVKRALSVLGYDDAPHGHAEVTLRNVRVPVANIILGEGRGFEVAQGRLGPGRIHHCMRAIGSAERVMDAMLARVTARTAFGKPLARQGTIQADIAASRIDIEAARLLVLACAAQVHAHGGRAARKSVAIIKVFVPSAVHRVCDRAVQAFGAAGLCQDTPLAALMAGMRSLRLADGPDAVHARTVALLELKEFLAAPKL